jgi:hypothetical protein
MYIKSKLQFEKTTDSGSGLADSGLRLDLPAKKPELRINPDFE